MVITEVLYQEINKGQIKKIQIFLSFLKVWKPIRNVRQISKETKIFYLNFCLDSFLVLTNNLKQRSLCFQWRNLSKKASTIILVGDLLNMETIIAKEVHYLLKQLNFWMKLTDFLSWIVLIKVSLIFFRQNTKNSNQFFANYKNDFINTFWE